MKQLQKGFTLIELLVVIAIIGLLAGIVLVSLGSARDSARDARIQSAVSQARSAAEIYANNNAFSYDGTCGDADVSRIVNDINDQGGSATCDDSGATFPAGYCIDATLPGSGDDICVSQNGVVEQSGSAACGTAPCD